MTDGKVEVRGIEVYLNETLIGILADAVLAPTKREGQYTLIAKEGEFDVPVQVVTNYSPPESEIRRIRQEIIAANPMMYLEIRDGEIVNISRQRPGRQAKLMNTLSEHQARVLNIIREAGETGVTNLELNHLCFRYGARIFELRNMGYPITKRFVKARVWKYILEVA